MPPATRIKRFMRWPTPALALYTVATLTGLICCLIIKKEPAILKATTSVILLAALFPAPQIRTTRRILVWVIFSTGHIGVKLLDRAKYLLAAGCTELVLGVFAAVVTWQYWKEARESDMSLRTDNKDMHVNASAKEKDEQKRPSSETDMIDSEAIGKPDYGNLGNWGQGGIEGSASGPDERQNDGIDSEGAPETG